MYTSKNTGRIVGILFLSLMIAYTIGALIIDPILNSSNYLIEASESKNKLLIGVFLELLNGLAYLGIAVLLYPIIKRLNESLAILYVGFRIIEFAMQMLSDMSPLVLITVSQDYILSNMPESSSFQPLGSALLTLRFWANQMVFITYSLGALIFYYSAYHLKLFPRLLCIWGLIGAPMVLVNVFLDSIDHSLVIDLGVVMGLNEIVLGIWLIVKGFNTIQSK
ncbi:DUF4386 domain-containing protein [Carboxylicivirga sp. M1479]|uniref:DUF4386 domain-containing protein n=1 Tax=Carboxylicivirga sp. M1479 TaxID=2594476 RepID=UPI001177633C|nr:DUF4386 domain-containing protein [Carboxylicivirga sp. M1479]TRX71538.1 DUF4386 domain-containing protein [Carboxylicivirga sp. M1479]